MPKPTEEIYLVRLETCGPLHVGSGETAKKTEYVYNAHKKQIEMLNLSCILYTSPSPRD